MIPELEQMYTAEEAFKSFPEVFTSHRLYFWQFFLPTEFVISEPKQLYPKVARCYNTPWYEVGGKLVDYEYLMKLPDFKGTSHYSRIFCIEMWSDHGDDGHTYYEMDGYAFFSEQKGPHEPAVDIAKPETLFKKMRDISYAIYDREMKKYWEEHPYTPSGDENIPPEVS